MELYNSQRLTLTLVIVCMCGLWVNKMICKKLMKVEGLLHKTYGIFVNDYHFANPCFGYRLAHIVVHIT